MKKLIYIIFIFVLACNPEAKDKTITAESDESNEEISTAVGLKDKTLTSNKIISKLDTLSGLRLDTLIGKKYKEINISGVESIGGAVIDDFKTSPQSNTLNKSFSIGQFKSNEGTILLLEEIIDSKNEKLSYQVLDYLFIAHDFKDKKVSYELCENNKIQNKEIVALVRVEDKEFYETIYKAWRANRLLGKFELIEPEGIRCYNEGFE